VEIRLAREITRREYSIVAAMRAIAIPVSRVSIRCDFPKALLVSPLGRNAKEK